MSTQNSNSSDWTTVGTSNQRNNRRVLNATQAQPTRRQPDNIPWVKGMKLGPGAPHGANFQRRIDESNQYSGAGTVNDPMVTWVVPQVDKKSDAEKAKLPAQTKVISDLTKDYGLSHAWIASEPHNTSTTKWVDGDRYIEDDDYHVTLRLGKSKDVCNLHGHAYLLFEDNDPAKQVKRTMLNKERSIKGGSNPQLWVWGNYPPESKDWPRTQVQYPSSPFEVMQNSILSKQLNGTSRTVPQDMVPQATDAELDRTLHEDATI
ncbi:hypothetical protein F5Y02DRAFT_418420 [Annulohypoxylon stygium]|nr:hypothetical protein F5Y02DRAFT_418420 [Annulohypoxylon stygium]